MVDINELTLGQIREITATFPAMFGKSNTTNTVSYTHLDVYKRQLLGGI